jgi:hypothetical protein
MIGNQPTITTITDDEDYYVVPVIEGPCIHNDIGFCYDMAHECHENQDSIQELHQAHQDGLASDVDRDRIYQGKTF